MDNEINKIVWNIIDKYFKENTNSLVEHHISSYNDFFKKDIYKIFKEKNPIRLQSNFDESIDDYRNKCLLYLGGKDGTKLYFGKPIIYDDKDNIHFMYPNEARLRNMNYGMTLHYDIDVEYINILNDNELPSMLNQDDFLDVLKESAEDYEQKKEFSNYKNTEILDINQTGGGPKKTKRTNRNKKEFKMTTNDSKEIKKTIEDSMIGPNTQKFTETIEKVYLGKFPIMLQSDFCILNGLSTDVRFNLGECKQDLGGYFIVQGKEKTIVSQEKFADNMLYIRKYSDEITDDDQIIQHKQYYSCEIRSVSENVSKPKRTTSISILTPNTKYTNKNIVVNIPNVRKPIPIFILFRALGVLTDKAIVEMCVLDLDKYDHFLDIFIPSVHDAGGVLTQKIAIDYIATFVKGGRTEHVLEILSDYFLPHIGEVNYTEKAYFLGYMVFRLISVYYGVEQPTDRDNYKYKRIELIGSLLNQLFSEYFTEQQNHIRLEYDKRLTFNLNLYSKNLNTLINNFQKEIFKNRIVEEGFKKAFKGNWGSKPNTKRIGVLQDLNRLSFHSYLSHLRKTNLSLPSSNKNTAPRQLHSSQWGFFDPVDTPDGGNIGLHKHLSISTYISRGSQTRDDLINWLREKISLKLLDECNPKALSSMTKVFVNGYWCGSIYNPIDCVNKFKLFRRNSLIPFDTSITFDIKLNTIFIYNDNGRLCRPIFYKDIDTKNISIDNSDIKKLIKNNNFSWENLVAGFNNKKSNIEFDSKHTNIYELSTLYDGIESENNPAKLERFIKNKAVIDYIDSSETENALIAFNYEDYNSNKLKYTHLEIHSSFILGSLSNMIIFPECNPSSRNQFSCGQTKQACSIFHTNFQNRMDKTSLILNYGQIPLIKSRYLEYINNEQIPYGENAIVAIMVYGGYNMEDSVLINEGAVKRGLFNTTYFSCYESHEEVKQTSEGVSNTKFSNIEAIPNINGLKPGYDYSKLDSYGLIKENTPVTDKTILIGTYNKSPNNPFIDMSKTPKKGQLGIVDKTFITDNEEGERIAKVRVRDVRIPNLGDKFASRAGQKGTIGLVVPEADMPFTKDGLKPDIIVNPHAIPSRMTVGQLVESIMGKTCAMMGGFGDCTAFTNEGSKVGVFGEMLTHFGYHSSGNDILYNGMTGEQIESEIFMGPTYYMRLKHMVKDKINYRARGPITSLTRQSVSGRANDGGLRIGEMERDAIVSHGIVDFLTESMMERCDKYKMAVCNNTGFIAIFNPNKNLFFSPVCDGPVQFSGSLDGKDLNIENISKFGRNFSIVNVPYSLKLLIHELMAANIQMRIITSDNIDQIENLTASNNVEKLSNLNNIDELKQLIRNRLQSSSKTEDDPFKDDSPEIMVKQFEPSSHEDSPPFVTTTPEDSPDWKPITPEDINIVPRSPNPDSPPYAPEYQPSTPDFPPPQSPLYSPTSPDFPPPDDSPPYGPDNLIVGSQVYYKNLPYKIINLSNNFITIEKINGDPNSNDFKEVVTKDEITTQPQVNKLMTGGANMNPNHSLNPFDNAPPINVEVKPVITVLGNENKGDIEIPSGDSQQMPNLNNEMTMITNPIIPKSNNIVPIENPNQVIDNIDKSVDFNKIQIKKI